MEAKPPFADKKAEGAHSRGWDRNVPHLETKGRVGALGQMACPHWRERLAVVLVLTENKEKALVSCSSFRRQRLKRVPPL